MVWKLEIALCMIVGNACGDGLDCGVGGADLDCGHLFLDVVGVANYVGAVAPALSAQGRLFWVQCH